MPLTTLLPTLVYSPPSTLLPLTLRPSWSQMVHVFLPNLWVPVALMVLFVFLMFSLHLLWLTTFFLFVDLQLTIPVLLNLTLLVLL
jgi:hypothetical protein